MKTFNNFTQLSLAQVLTGTPVTVLEPAKIEGVVQASGDGLTLPSGNVFVPQFDDMEATTGRRIQLVADEFVGDLSARINTYTKDSSGGWVADSAGRTSALFYAGQLWWPADEIPYRENDYLIQSWNLVGDQLEVLTSDGLYYVFNRFLGISQPELDLVTPVAAPRQFGDGTRTAFDAPNTTSTDPANLLVVIDGFVQSSVHSYTSQPGQITFSEAPPVGAEIDITYFYPITIDGIEGIIPVVAPRHIADGVTNVFSTPSTEVASPSSFSIAFDGLLQRPVTDYTIDAQGRAVFVETPDVGTQIDITFFNPSAVELNPQADLSFNPVTAAGSTAPRDLRDRFSDVANILDFGARTDADSTAAITAAIATGRTVFIPEGNFFCTATTLPSGTTIVGTGNKSYLKFVVGYSGNMFVVDSNTSNVSISGVHIEGSENYPADYTTNKEDVVSNTALLIRGGFSDIEIKDCYFTDISYCSIRTGGYDGEKLTITGCTFNNANYGFKALGLYTDSPYTEGQRHSLITVSNNTFTGGGVLYHYDPLDPSYTNSTDCVHLDAAKNSKVVNNTFKDVGGVAIRIEESVYSIISGNSIDGAGSSGISLYKNCYYCTVSDNSVYRWGITVPASKYRVHNGLYVVAREFPDASNAILPSDPATSPWFSVNPYFLKNVDTSKIPAYDSSDYYDGSSNPGGILPHRGTGAIMVTQQSSNNVITGNVVKGISTQTSGANDYCTDFGISFVETANGPSGSFVNKNTCSNNTVSRVELNDFYHPDFIDPVNGNGSLGVVAMQNNVSDSAEWWTNSTVRNNKLPTYEDGEYTATLVPSSGSLTMDGRYDELAYVRIGNMVKLTGQLYVSAVNAPGGTLSFQIPIPTSNLGERSDRFIGYARVYSSGVADKTTNFSIDVSFDNRDTAYISAADGSSVASRLVANSSIVLEISYLTDQDLL